MEFFLSFSTAEPKVFEQCLSLNLLRTLRLIKNGFYHDLKILCNLENLMLDQLNEVRNITKKVKSTVANL
jgi:hypothetical protein